MGNRKIAWILIICVLFTSIPATVLAAGTKKNDSIVTGDWPDEGDTLIDDYDETASDSDAIYPTATLGSKISTASQSDILPALTIDTISSMVSKMLLDLAKNKAGGAAKWAAGSIYSKLFPGSKETEYEEIQRMLNQIIANQDSIMRSLEKIGTTMDAKDFAEKLNEYKKLSATGTQVKNAIRTLNSLEGAELIEEELVKRRQHAVTDGINITVYDSGATELENYLDKLYTLITMKYEVTLSDGTETQMDLAEIQYEYTRLNPDYYFEHEAYDDLISFQAYCYGNFLDAASIDMLSLQARLDKCHEKGLIDDSVQSALATLVDQINDVEKSLAKTRVERQDTYRYFWVRGYEVKMYTQTELHLKPREDRWSDNYEQYDLGKDWCDSKGFVNKNPEDTHNYSFWHSFWTCSATGKQNCLTGDQYKKLVEGAKKRNAERGQSSEGKNAETLYDLLFTRGKLDKSTVTYMKKSYETSANESYMFLPDEKYPFKNEKAGSDNYHLYSGGIANVTLKDGFTAKTVELGNYQKAKSYFTTEYRAYQTRNLNEDMYVLIVPYTDGNEGDADTAYSYTEIKETDDSPVVDLNERASAVTPDKAVTPVTIAQNGNQLFGSAVISVAVKNLTDNEKLQLVETAVWSRSSDGHWYLYDQSGNKYKNCWVLLSDACGKNPIGNASWYYFGSDGAMQTGWVKIKNAAGKELWYYFNREDGSLYGACLLSGTTPDNYKVDENGAWIEN